jgi:Flp pilus assembly pilin Flp
MKDNKGQALIEYILIITLITILAVSLIKIFGGYLTDAVTKSSCNLVGKIYQEGEKTGEGTCIDNSEVKDSN